MTQKKHKERRTGRQIRRGALAAAIAMGSLQGCGGGGGGEVTAAAPTPPQGVQIAEIPAPTDKSAAVDLQYQRVVELRQVVREILEADKAAMQALVDGHPADWDEYWTNDYPLLLDKLGLATANLNESEDHVHRLVYGLAPDAADGEVQPKFVPVPVVLAAVVAITAIYQLEQSGYRERWAQQNAAQHQSLSEMLRQVYVDSGMPVSTAEARARIDAGAIQTLQQLQSGIDTAKTFVFENFTIPALSSLLPKDIGTLVDLNDIRKQLAGIKGNIEAIFTTPECRSIAPAPKQSPRGAWLDPERGATAAAVATKATGGCRVYFCSTAGDSCEDLPAGQWEAAIFAPGRLRDVDLDVSAQPTTMTEVQGTLVAATDLEDPPPVVQCSAVQNAGGDLPDTRTVPLGAAAGSFTLSYQMYGIKDRLTVSHDGAPVFDSGCVSNGATQRVSFSGLASFVTVAVEPNCSGGTSGTAWNYSLTCPAQN